MHVHRYWTIRLYFMYTVLLQRLWVGVMCTMSVHHWAEGQCQHEPMSEPGEGKEWIYPTCLIATDTLELWK